MKKRIFLYGMVLFVILGSFAACSGAADYSPSTTESARDSADYDYPMESDEAAYEAYDYEYEDYEGEYASPGQSGSSEELPLAPSTDESKIVYDVNMQLQTTDFEEGTRELLQEVRNMDGYVQSTYIRGRSLYDQDARRFARYTVRIPSENLAQFLRIMEDNYNLLELMQDSYDVTQKAQYTDSRLDSLRDQEERLLAALENAEDTEEQLRLERELASVQVEISRLASTAGAIQNDVIYSTVTIKLHEVIFYDEIIEEEISFGARLDQTASRSLASFVAFWENAVLFFVAALPTLIILAIICAVIFLIVKLAKKYEKKHGKKLFQQEKKPRPQPPVMPPHAPMAPPQAPPANPYQAPPAPPYGNPAQNQNKSLNDDQEK